MIVRSIPGATRTAFERLNTSGDAQRFASATQGFQAMLSATGTSATYTLPFPYLVGDNQLEVFVFEGASNDTARRLANKAVIDAEAAAARISGAEQTALLANGHFIEVDSETVTVNNIASAANVLWFVVPHTSVPALTTNKIIVEAQVTDRTAIRLLGSGDGLEYTTPDGQRGRLFISNNHQVVTQRL